MARLARDRDARSGASQFTRRIIAVRKAFPILYRPRFVLGNYNEELGVKDVTWLSPTGAEMTQQQWGDANARCFAMLLDGRAQESGIIRRGGDATLLLIYNSHYDGVNFTLPSVAEGLAWERLLDTNDPDLQQAPYPFGSVYTVTGRSLVAFGLTTSSAADIIFGAGL